jgi:hypothetical protein
MVRLPTAAEHIRLAPVRVLRAVFSRFGQLLLAADRLRADDSARERADRDDQRQQPLEPWEGRLSANVRVIPRARSKPSAAAPHRAARAASPARPVRLGKPAHDAKHAKSGGGRTRTQSARTPARAKKPTEPSHFRSLDVTGNVRVLSDKDVAEIEDDSPGRPAEPGELPIADYDGLSLASIRARLRYLDADQLQRLVDYELSQARRGDVVTMLERRIAKLTGTAGEPHSGTD